MTRNHRQIPLRRTSSFGSTRIRTTRPLLLSWFAVLGLALFVYLSGLAISIVAGPTLWALQHATSPSCSVANFPERSVAPTAKP